MNIFTAFLVSVAAMIGIVVLLAVRGDPKRFWPALIVATVCTSGIMLSGYTMVDEYLVGCILLSVGGLLLLKHQKGDYGNGTTRLHATIFAVWMAYLILQSFRGMVLLASLQKIRWVVFFLMLGMLASILRRRKLSSLSARDLAFQAAGAALIYFSVYVGYGLFAEVALGISRYQFQFAQMALYPTGSALIKALAIWGTTAYVMFPLAIAMPAVLIILKDKSPAYRRVGWATVLVSTFAAFYYDSRVSVLTIVAFLVISVPSLGLVTSFKTLLVSLAVFAAVFFFVWRGGRDISYVLSDIFGSGSNLFQSGQTAGGGRDVDRTIHLKIAFASISDRWDHFLFGYGYRMSGYVIGPYIAELSSQYNVVSGSLENVSTEAFTDYVVDTGMIGLALLGVNCALLAHRILSQKANPYRLALLLSIFIIFAWMAVINILDIMLLYLAIMPSGLLDRLSCYEPLPVSKSNHGGQDIRRILPRNTQ